MSVHLDRSEEVAPVKTTRFGDTSHAAILPFCATRERYLFGHGAYIAPVISTVQGTSVSGAAEQQVTLATMAVPAAVNDGARSGQRLGRPPV